MLTDRITIYVPSTTEGNKPASFLRKLTYIGEDYWGRETYRDERGRYYRIVDGVMHTSSPSNDIDGEPDCPVPAGSYEILNPLTDKQRLEKEHKFDYMMLGRLKSDIEAYLNVPGDCRYRNNHLVNATQTIVEMRKYWARIPDEVKPEWITEEQINKYDSIMNRRKYLEDLGFGLDRAEGGYYRLMAGRELLVDDSAGEDLYDEESAWASYYDLIEEMQQDEIASTDDCVNAVYAYNSYASCAESAEEALAVWYNLNANDGLIIEHTPENTDEDEWSSLCDKLDLSRENNARRILEKKSRGLIVCLGQDFDFVEA